MKADGTMMHSPGEIPIGTTLALRGGQYGPAGWGLFCEKPQEIERGILQPGQWTDDTSMATHPKSYASYGEGGQFDRDAHSIRIPIHNWFT